MTQVTCKGFMFSIEALASIAILCAVLGIAAYYIIPNESSTNLHVIRTQNDSVMGVYFGQHFLPEVRENMYCRNVVYYQNKLVQTETVCG